MAEEVMDELSWAPSFSEAFATAKRRGLVEFNYKGKRFSTAVQPPGDTGTSGSRPASGATAAMSFSDNPSLFREGRDPVGETRWAPGDITVNPNAQFPSLMEVVTSEQARSPGLDLTTPSQGSFLYPPTPNITGGQIQPTTVTANAMAPGQGVQDSFDMANQQLDPSYTPGPPKTPEERAQRVSGWREFLNRLGTDQSLQMMMLKMGTSLMQPIAPTQSIGGHVGQAIQGAVDYTQSFNEIQRRAGLEGRQADLGEKTAEQQMAESRQRVSSSKTAQQGQLLEQDEFERTKSKRMEKLELDLSNARTSGEVEKLKLDNERWIFKNKDRLTDLEINTAQARLRAEEARVKAYEAALSKAEKGVKNEGEAARAAAMAFTASVDTDVIRAYVQSRAARGEKVDPQAVPLEQAKQEFFMMNPGMAKEYYKQAALIGIPVEQAGVVAGQDAAQAGVDPNSDAAAIERSTGTGIIYERDKSGKLVPRGGKPTLGKPSPVPTPELNVP